MKDVALGIDIGGTNTKFGFVDHDGNMYGETSISTIKTAPGDVEAYLKYVYEEIEKLRSTIDEEMNIVGCGIGAPNGNYFTGTYRIRAQPDFQRCSASGSYVPSVLRCAHGAHQ